MARELRRNSIEWQVLGRRKTSGDGATLVVVDVPTSTSGGIMCAGSSGAARSVPSSDIWNGPSAGSSVERRESSPLALSGGEVDARSPRGVASASEEEAPFRCSPMVTGSTPPVPRALPLSIPPALAAQSAVDPLSGLRGLPCPPWTGELPV